MATYWPPARKARVYLAAAVGWTWLFWFIVIALARPFADPLGMTLFIAGAAGVPGAAFLLLLTIEDERARRDYWRRLIDFRRIGAIGWLVIVLLPPALALIAAAASALHTGSWPEFAPVRGFLAAPLTLAPFAVFIMLFGPLPEELGWRGYALGALQIALGPLAAAIILGIVHAAWHLPMFYMEGSHHYDLGAFSLAFWRYMLSVVFLSIVLTGLFNATAGSTLAAILLHFTNNLTGELLRLPDLAEWYRFALFALVAIGLVIATRGRLRARS
jgi:uncharacterized protein